MAIVKGWRYWTVFILVALGVALVIWWPHVRSEFFTVLGNRNEPGGWYGWWSGNAGGLQLFEWIVLGGILLRHHNCHVHGCPWPGRYPMAGGEFTVCKHHSHHPEKITHKYVLDRHEEHKRCAPEPPSSSP
jgi:hypothetical protein